MHALLQPEGARTLTRHSARHDPPRPDRRETNRPVARPNYALEFVADAFGALRPSAFVQLAPGDRPLAESGATICMAHCSTTEEETTHG
jgi:hypothetical protein